MKIDINNEKNECVIDVYDGTIIILNGFIIRPYINGGKPSISIDGNEKMYILTDNTRDKTTSILIEQL